MVARTLVVVKMVGAKSFFLFSGSEFKTGRKEGLLLVDIDFPNLTRNNNIIIINNNTAGIAGSRCNKLFPGPFIGLRWIKTVIVTNRRCLMEESRF